MAPHSNRIRFLGVVAVFACAACAALVACVDVPDGVRAQFAEVAPQERSNYRPGAHGVAAANVDPADLVVVAATDAGAAPIASSTTTAIPTPTPTPTPSATTTTTSATTDGGAP
jgi:hypothetical protein